MKLPSTLRIIGRDWKVEEVEEINDAFGLCRKEELKLQVEKGLPLDLKIDTFIHEVLHAIDWAMNTELTEKQNTSLATGIAAVFKDNPKLAGILWSKKSTEKG